ncbi:MAG: DUF3108 domain-containing protein [Desulfuromonas sp.]|nr:DUF3108 domain-containing protein [Desulfuromonas sp.]
MPSGRNGVILDTPGGPYYTELPDSCRQIGWQPMRRMFFSLLMLGAVLAGTVFAVSQPLSRPVLPQRSFQQMIGEHHRYTLDFLVFRDLAEGHLQLTAEKTPGRFRAELEARTLGVASWLTGERTQRYVSIMEEDASGRLRSISHESSIHKRKWGKWNDRGKRYRFDYLAGKVYQEKGENGEFRPGPVFELPVEQSPVDILTGFYNLRAGVYGPLTAGAHMKIATFTTRGISDIEVEVLSDNERLARPFFPTAGTLLRIKVDPEVFDTGGADLYAWFDETGRPARGIVENVIGLGDVYGRLNEEQKQP